MVGSNAPEQNNLSNYFVITTQQELQLYISRYYLESASGDYFKALQIFDSHIINIYRSSNFLLSYSQALALMFISSILLMNYYRLNPTLETEVKQIKLNNNLNLDLTLWALFLKVKLNDPSTSTWRAYADDYFTNRSTLLIFLESLTKASSESSEELPADTIKEIFLQEEEKEEKQEEEKQEEKETERIGVSKEEQSFLATSKDATPPSSAPSSLPSTSTSSSTSIWENI